MVKSGRLPFYLCVACLAVGAELSRGVRWVGCFIEILFVAAIAGIGCVEIIVVVTFITTVGNFRMCPFNHVIFIVISKGGWLPVGRGLMAQGTVIR